MSLRLLLSVLTCGLVLAACGPTMEVPDDAEACAGIQCTAGECFSNGGQPMCRCGAWEVAAGLTCEVGAFETPDEMGGSPGTATVLTLPMEVRVAALQVGLRPDLRDRDLFAFTAEAGHVYAFHCGEVSLGECKPRLLDGSGRPVPLAVSRELRNGIQVFWVGVAQVETAGTWYVEVSSESSRGQYRYQLVDLGPDDHASSREDATRLQAFRDPLPFSVTHSTPEDRDVFTFRAVADHGYRFVCERDSTVYQELELTTAGGVVVDVLSPYAVNRAVVGGMATQTADWFVKLRAMSSRHPATSSCRLEDLGTDEHADGLAGATPVVPGLPVSVTLQSRSDTDVLSFTGEPDHFYGLRTEGAGLEECEARVTSATGQPLAVGTSRSLRFEPAARGTYYLFLERCPTWMPTFLLTVVDLGQDDHGDTPDTATVMSVGSILTGRFETQQDVDAIAFPAQARHVYLADCGLTCDVRMGSVGRVPAGFAPLSPGQYLVHARWTEQLALLLSPRPGVQDFGLRLQRVAIDEYGDNALNAEPLTLPATLSGSIQTGVDEDAFSVELVSGRRYRLTSSLGTLRIDVVGPNGLPVGFVNGTFTAFTSGRYLVRVSGGSGLQLLAWSFTLREQ